jgi:diadenosine tetraphosphatase ApaH/serine/threonine PP2A family protein phosphatase
VLSAVAALYDVHGNLPALDAVLSELDSELILVGGDVAGGPWPTETLERLRGLGDRVRFIRGNADREVAEAPKPGREGGPPPALLDFVRERLSAEQMEFLGRLPLTESLDVAGLGAVLFCHATPRSDDELLTRISPDERWRSALSMVGERVVVCGHTHVQFDRRVGDLRVVNAGSVGMPYEHEPGAYWAMLGPEVELRRTPYEPPDIAASGWPEEWPSATPEDATEHFERISRQHA